MTKHYGSLAVAALVALAASGGCEFKNTHNGATPSPIATATASPASANALVGTWTSQMVATTGSTAATTATAPPTIESCRNFKWVAGAQSATSASGDFTLTCNGTIPLSGSASAQLAGTSVQITVTGTATLPGVGACAFSLSGNGTLVTADTLRVPYTGTTCVGPVAGNETLLRNQVFPAPPAPLPAPEPPPLPPSPPTPVPVPVGSDQIDLSQATILNSPLDLARWNISTRITQVDITQNGIHLEVSPDVFNGPNKWPEASFGVQYTLGMCLNISARWYCSAVVQFWTGLAASGGPPNEYAQNWFYDAIRWSPMTGHQPAVGETIGFFACMGDCRNNTKGDLSPLRERTNVVLVQMPGPGGAVFRF